MFPPLEATQKAIVTAVSVPLLFIAFLWIGRWLKRRQGVRLGILYVIFSTSLAVFIGLQFYRSDFPFASGVIQALSSLLVVLGAFVLIALIRRFVWELWFERNRQTRAPKFLGELIALIIILISIVIALQIVMQKSIPGLLAGSGIAAAVLGFAMQDLLGNLIAGVAIEIGKPFKPGDWLIVEGQRGEVIEVNWRSTRLRTNDDICLDIPNKTMVGSTITNLTYPTRQHAIRIPIHFDNNVPPNFVKDCMRRAAAHAPGVLTTPPPKVFLLSFGESAIFYEIKFYMENEASYNDIVDGIRTNVWYEAQRNNIRIPFPTRSLRIDRSKPRREQNLEHARSSVSKHPFLQLFDSNQTDRLLTNAKLLRFGRGEKVIEQGDNGDSMFVMLNGEAAVLVAADGRESQVATLRAGDYFGEMSLLTGEPRSATVCVTRDSEMWEIDKEVLGEILQENEALVQKLSEMLAKRRLETEGIMAASHEQTEISAKKREYTEGFLRKLYSFFEL